MAETSEDAKRGPIHRHPLVQGDKPFIATWDPEIDTLAAAWKINVKKFPKRNCMGTREQLEGGKVGGYKWKTYEECNERVVNVGSAYRQIGLPEKAAIGLYAQNMESWVVCEQACYQHNYRIVSIYDTLGPDVCEYVINHAEMVLVIVQASKLDAILKSAKKCETLKYVVTLGTSIKDEERAAAKEAEVELMTIADFEKLGKENPHEVRFPKPDDLCTIMYTSGTTGMPKGVMLSHANQLSVIASGLATGIQVDENDVHLSYLPLSHVFERTIMAVLFSHGGCCAFFQGNPKLLLDDMQAVQPTMFFGVPRVFNLLHDRVMTKLKEANFIKRWMFNMAYKQKLEAIAKGEDTPRWNSFVFSKIRDTIVGPRCRLVISGAAPLSDTVQNFIRCIFCCPVLQGFGLTETCSASTLQHTTETNTYAVGPPLPCCEICLEDVPELNYTSSGEKEQGEILIRGLSVFSGYYKNEKETKAVLTSDGWFHTGDIGEWLKDGSLKVIDRRKNIFKLSQGEYVAVEKLEVMFAPSPFIQQIWIHGDSKQSYIIAFVVPNPDYAAKWAGHGSATDTKFLEEICKDPKFNKAVMDDITRLGKENKLAGYEFPKHLYLEPNMWSVENEMLTPTSKLKRPGLIANYKKQIEEMYARAPASTSS